MFFKLKKAAHRYGLDSCDLPTMFSNVGTMLRLVTVNIDKNNKKKINIFSYIFVATAFASYFYVYFFSVIWFLFVRTPQTRDWTTAIVELSLSACSQCSIVKIVFAIVFEKNIQNLVEVCISFDALSPPGIRFVHNLHVNLRKIKKRVLVIWSILCINGLLYILTPLFRPGRHYPEDLFIVYGFEPMFNSPNFEIASFMMYISVLFTVFSLANVTALTLIIVGYTEAQMITLSTEMYNLWDDANAYTRIKRHVLKNKDIKSMNNIFIKRQLAHISRFHVINIDLISKLEQTFRLSKAGEFLIGMLSIITELLGGIENTYLQIPYTLFLIYIDCLAGQRLIDACAVFEDSVYACNWQYFDKENMKTVWIILQNSQKTLNLTAGGIAVLDYTCMVSFYKLCYSMYTTLRVVVD